MVAYHALHSWSQTKSLDRAEDKAFSDKGFSDNRTGVLLPLPAVAMVLLLEWPAGWMCTWQHCGTAQTQQIFFIFIKIIEHDCVTWFGTDEYPDHRFGSSNGTVQVVLQLDRIFPWYMNGTTVSWPKVHVAIASPVLRRSRHERATNICREIMDNGQSHAHKNSFQLLVSSAESSVGPADHRQMWLLGVKVFLNKTSMLEDSFFDIFKWICRFNQNVKLWEWTWPSYFRSEEEGEEDELNYMSILL